MTEAAKQPIRCAWCEIELAAIDAAPIKYARLEGAPDEENMQCADYKACQARQDELDAAQRREAVRVGLSSSCGNPDCPCSAATAAGEENAK